MNIKNKYLKKLLGIFVLIIFALYFIISQKNLENTDEMISVISANSSGSVVLGSLDGSNTKEAYTMVSSDGRKYYCANPMLASTRRAKNTKQTADSEPIIDGGYSNARQETTYTLSKTVKVPQTVGYAKWQNASDSEMQDIIWASWQWSDYEDSCLLDNDGLTLSVNSGGVRGRSQRFANFIYKVLDNGEKFNVTTTPTEEDSKDIKVLVDQDAKTYTVGPYKIDFATSNQTTIDGIMKLGDLVYQEIVNDFSGKFIWGEVTANILYDNGDSNVSEDIELLNASGEVISEKFPKFGQEFYIRYSTDDDIKEICPNIGISFITKITGTADTYKSSEVQYIIHDDYSGLVLKPVMRSYGFTYLEDLDAFVDLNKLDVSEPDDPEGVINDMKAFIENGLTEVAVAAGYPVSELTLDVGTKGNGYHIGWYSDETEQMYEGYYKFVTSRDVLQEKTRYYIQDADGSDPWWSDYVPDGFEGSVLQEKKYTKFKEKCVLYVGETELHTEEVEYWEPEVPEGESGSSRGDIDGAYDLAKAWAQNNLRRAIRFDKDYPKITEKNEYMQSVTTITITPPTVPPPPPPPYEYPKIKIEKGSTAVGFPGRIIDMYIGGYVWEDIEATKENYVNGRFDSNIDKKYAGIQVKLHDNNTGQIVATTTTDSNGAYGFQDLNPMHKYYVEFTYNGQIYQQTYYKDDLSGGYSTAKESVTDRQNLNKRFETIDSTPNNYAVNNIQYKSYGLYVRIPASDGTYISYTPNVYTDGENAGALRYCDVLEIFKQLNVNSKKVDNSNRQTMDNTYNTLSYDKSYSDVESSLKSKLREIFQRQNKSISDSELNSIWQYINHCMISAYTISYPKENKFVLDDIDNPHDDSVLGYPYLYNSKSDQSRNVDFGINERDTADLAIQKDVYKATVRVNGKTQTYMYNQKDADIDEDGNWNITVRQADYLYNGTTKYTREIRKSEYLYDGTIYNVGQNASARDLQVYITYRIVVRNQSQTYDTKVNEIVDYFDSSEYTFDGKLNGNTYTPNSYSDFEHSEITSYIGDRSGNYLAPLTVKNVSSLGNGRGNTNIGHNYSSTPLYLSGILQTDKNDRLSAGGGMAFIYITFKVNTHTDENGMNNRVQMDVNVKTGEEKLGKRNIAEINGYSTYYRKNTNNNPALIPDYLDNNNGRHDKDVSGNIAGTIDRDSSVGNLSSQDLNNNGDLIITDNVLTNRTEDDTDKAPTIRLVFPEDNGDDPNERVATGYVYEDERNTESDKAMVGNGVHDGNETLIDGVTVQLVELIQDVDSNGIPTGNYLGEYVWNAVKWNNNTWENVNSNMNNSGSLRYYSGQGQFDKTVAPIISGPGITEISGYTFDNNAKGRYAFKGVPAGDFIIRFIYGDTTQTVLTTTSGEGSEVTSLLNGVSDGAFLGTSGLNNKSYNGQDYKSTTYQAGVDQNGSYNGIKGYVDYNNQNYNLANDIIPSYGYNSNGTNKNVNYYYDIAKSEAKSDISDAKDIGNIRTKVNNYSSGLNNIDNETGKTLVNGRAEVLASALKVGSTGTQQEQVAMLKELMANTAMVAQTGVINTEIEHNTIYTDNQSSNNSKNYVLKDIDLGLSERPVAQLKMNKEVSNVRITLQNGTVLFDTNRPVTNMPFADHKGHTIVYNPKNPAGKAYRLVSVAIANNTTNTPELITTYMDEELMYGARIEVEYTFTVTNVGEVDYLDNKFYYTGKTNNTDANNISTTSANTVVDYISNNIQFLPTNSNNKDYWSIRTVNDLTTNPDSGNSDVVGNRQELINNKYYSTLNTYNNIVTTKALGKALYPEATGLDGSSAQTKMLLSTTLVPDSGEDTMVYNNLCEIVQISNTQGRRLKYSITGNQPMANQEYGSDKTVEQGYTKVDLVTPTEIDADSAQKLLILPPTGANRNYTLWIIVGIVALAIITGGIVLIRRYFRKNK